MPTQAEVQQLLQDRLGLQTEAQRGVPLVNNGNPNTVYNTPATPIQPWTQAFNAMYGANSLPPMVTANGLWHVNQPPQYTPWQAPSGGLTPNMPVWPQAFSPANMPTPGSWFPGGTNNPPPGTGGNTPPLPGTGGGGGGGGGGPGGGGGLDDPRNPNDHTGTTVFGDNSPFNQSFSIYDPVYKSVWGNSDGPNVDLTDLRNFMSRFTDNQLAVLAGLRNTDGSFDWRQALDMITEPWFQTNMYLSGLDSWDTSNILAGLAQAITGLPWNSLMQKLGEGQAFQDDPQNWLERQLVDHWRDNVSNDIANYSNQLSYLIQHTAQGGNENGTANTIYDFYNSLMGGRLNNGTDIYGRNGTWDGWGYAGGDDVGCVTVDSHIRDFGRAGDVKVGDELTVIDPKTYELSKGKVSYSETKPQPTVRITTKHYGIILDCSKSAPIADVDGNQVTAEHLLGVEIPVLIDNDLIFDTVMKVEDLGEQLVQHITCENNFFLAGVQEGKYLLHHNMKKGPDSMYNNWVAQGGWGGALGSVFGGGAGSGGSGTGGGGLGGGGYYGTGGTFGSFGF